MKEDLNLNAFEAVINFQHRHLSTVDAANAARRVRELGPTSIARGLHAKRQKLGITQREAARRIGVEHMTYHHWELGRYWPSSIYLPLIAEAFCCGIADLYLEEGGDE